MAEKRPRGHVALSLLEPPLWEETQKSGIPKNLMWEPSLRGMEMVSWWKDNAGLKQWSPVKLGDLYFWYQIFLSVWANSELFCKESSIILPNTQCSSQVSLLMTYQSVRGEKWWALLVFASGWCRWQYLVAMLMQLWLLASKKQIFSPSGNHCWRQVVWI